MCIRDSDSTEAGLREFWKGGMQRAWNEKIVSVGMRGDGDAPMSRETATELLERIVKDQRQIIEEVTGKPASETPQLWALYLSLIHISEPTRLLSISYAV